MIARLLSFGILSMLPFLVAAQDRNQSNIDQLQSQILKTIQLQGVEAAWQEYQDASLSERARSTDATLRNILAEGADYSRAASEIEFARTILLGIAYPQLAMRVHSAASDGNETREDIINYHALIALSRNRPSEISRHSEWHKFGESQEPIYRLAAINLIMSSWPDSVDKSDSERNEFTYTVMLERRSQLGKFASDQDSVVRDLAQEKIDQLQETIARMEDEYGMEASSAESLTTVKSTTSNNPTKASDSLPDQKQDEQVDQTDNDQEKVAHTQSTSTWLFVIFGIILLAVIGVIGFKVLGKSS